MTPQGLKDPAEARLAAAHDPMVVATNPKAKTGMRLAWEMVRHAKALYQGPAHIFMAEALKIAWAEVNSDPVIREVARIIAESRARNARQSETVGSGAMQRAAARRRARLGTYYSQVW